MLVDWIEKKQVPHRSFRPVRNDIVMGLQRYRHTESEITYA
jgi:hypothetical protein